jgi:hypothetical protein
MPEVPSAIHKILAESEALFKQLKFHKQAMKAHSEQKERHQLDYNRHEENWRNINIKLAANVEKARVLKEAQMASRTREYFVINT